VRGGGRRSAGRVFRSVPGAPSSRGSEARSRHPRPPTRRRRRCPVRW
jgi:hypothetical protein